MNIQSKWIYKANEYTGCMNLKGVSMFKVYTQGAHTYKDFVIKKWMYLVCLYVCKSTYSVYTEWMFIQGTSTSIPCIRYIHDVFTKLVTKCQCGKCIIDNVCVCVYVCRVHREYMLHNNAHVT